MIWCELLSGEFFNMDKVESLSVSKYGENWGIVVCGTGHPRLLKRLYDNEQDARAEMMRILADGGIR